MPSCDVGKNSQAGLRNSNVARPLTLWCRSKTGSGPYAIDKVMFATRSHNGAETHLSATYRDLAHHPDERWASIAVWLRILGQGITTALKLALARNAFFAISMDMTRRCVALISRANFLNCTCVS